MSSIEQMSEERASVRNDLSAIFVSLELSRSTWLITSLSPGGGEKMSKHQVRGGDVAGLLARFSQLQAKCKARTGQLYRLIVIHKAGLDGFWIHRTLQNAGIESHVVDPASIAGAAPALHTHSVRITTIVCMLQTVAGSGLKCQDFRGRQGFEERQAFIADVTPFTPVTPCTYNCGRERI